MYGMDNLDIGHITANTREWLLPTRLISQHNISPLSCETKATLPTHLCRWIPTQTFMRLHPSRAPLTNVSVAVVLAIGLMPAAP